MEVDDLVRIGVDEEVGDQRQPSSQDDETDVVLLEQGQHDVGIVEVSRRSDSRRSDSRRHTETLCTHEGVGVGLITDNESAMYALGVGKVFNQVLAVGTAA